MEVQPAKPDNLCVLQVEGLDDEMSPSLPPTPTDDNWILAPVQVLIQKMNKTRRKQSRDEHAPDTGCKFLLETLIPFLFAGIGLILAGYLLDTTKDSVFFTRVPEAMALVPVLLGLKGNLEMTLASRLSTLANLGFMDTREQTAAVTLANMALIQTQAIVVSSFAVLITAVTDLLRGEHLVYSHVASLMLTAVATASIASYVLGLLMTVVVILARRYRLNPDNITTPVAASLGDVSTLLFMLGIGGWLLSLRDSHPWAVQAMLALFFLSAVVGAVIAYRDQFTRQVLKHGWWAVLTAMLVSSFAGFIFSLAVHEFPGIASFHPVINGVGGNLVAVQASRISTGLHRARKLRVPESDPLLAHCSPLHAFLGHHEDAVAARILSAISLPGHLLFMLIIFSIGNEYQLTPHFAVGYLFIGVLQVVTLLFVCQWLVRAMWRCRVDPDSSAIPVLTALGDLLGTVLLAGCLVVLSGPLGLPLHRDQLPAHVADAVRPH